LPDLVRHGGFKLLDIKQEGEQVVVRFSFDPTADKSRVNKGTVNPSTSKVREGTVTLLPKHQWAIKAYDVKVSYGAGIPDEKATAEYQYGPSEDGAAPVLVSTHEHNTGGLTSDFSFSDWKWSGAPEADFRLSHFDLPEPAEYVSPGSGLTWLVWVNAGVILLILAVIFRRRARNTPSSPGTSTA
jgi:hypothetical protein